MNIEAIIAELEKRYHMVPRRTIEDPNALIPFFELVSGVVCEHFNTTAKNMYGKYKGDIPVLGREFTVVLVDKHFKGTVNADLISKLLCKDRTTMISMRKRAKLFLEIDKKYKAEFDKLEQNFLLKYNEEKFNLEQRK